MRLWMALGVVAICCLAGTSQAGVIVGASVLSTDAEIEDAAEKFDTDDIGYKFFGGFNFIRFFGVEASYRNLGTHEDTAGKSSVEAEIEGIDVSARGILPIGKRFEVFAKAGYALVRYDGHFDGGSRDLDEDEWAMLYGVDASLNTLSVGAYFKF